jgi:hypothetical protein
LTLKCTGGADDDDEKDGDGDLSARNWATNRPPSGAAGNKGISGGGDDAAAAAARRSNCERCSAGVKSAFLAPGLPAGSTVVVTGSAAAAGIAVVVVVVAVIVRSTCGGGSRVGNRGAGCENCESSVLQQLLLLLNPCPAKVGVVDVVDDANAADEEETVLLRLKVEFVLCVLSLPLLLLLLSSGSGGISGTRAKSGSLSELES